MEGSSPYCCRKDKPSKSLSLKIGNGAEVFGTLTVISMITLNFHSVGMTLNWSVATVTRFVEAGVRVDEVVLLGEESEPRDVLAVEIVTPLGVDARPAAEWFEVAEDLAWDERGRICRLIRFSGSDEGDAAGVDRFVFPKGVSLLGEKNDVRGFVVDFPFFCGVEVDPLVGVDDGGSVSMLSSLWRRVRSMELCSISPDFLVRVELVDM